MSAAAQRPTGPSFRLRRRRFDVRPLLAGALLVGLLAASSVVSAAAFGRLPLVWQSVVAGTTGPRLPGLDDPQSHLQREATTARIVDGSQEPSLPPVLAPPVGLGVAEDGLDRAVDAFRLRPEDYASDWLQAGTGPDRLGTVPRSHQVQVGPSGTLRGRLADIGATAVGQSLERVRLLLFHRGVLAATTRTAADGTFEVAGLRTGTYAFVVATDDFLLAYGLHVLQGRDEVHEHQLDSPLIAGDQAVTALRQVLTLPAEGIAQLELIEPPEPLIPQAVRSIPRDGRPGTSLRTHPVRQQSSGNLIGRVHCLHPVSGRPLRPPLTEVVLYRDGRIVTVGRTDEQGVFATGRVEPGIFTLIARTVLEPDDTPDRQRVDVESLRQNPVGLLRELPPRAGFAAFAVEVIPAVSLVSASTGEGGLLPGPDEPLELDFALIDRRDLLSTAHASSVGGDRTLTGNATSTGSRTAAIAAAAAAALTPLLTNSGGGGGPISFPIIPGGGGDDGNSTMSPATL